LPGPFHRGKIKGEIKGITRGDIKEYIKKGKIETNYAIVLARSPLDSVCGMTNFGPLTARALSRGRNKGRNKGSHKGRHKGRYTGMKN